MLDTVNYQELSDNDFIDCEYALNGILLDHPDKVLPVSNILSPEAFFLPENQKIYETIQQKFREGQPLDPRSASVEMRELKPFIAECVAAYASKLNAIPYAKTIMGAYYRRQIKNISESTTNEDEKAEQIADIWKKMSANQAHEGVVTLQDAMERTYQKIEDNYRNGGGIRGLKTGLSDLDRKLCGLDEGGLYVIAARPAMGKSALAITLAANMSLSGKAVQFFSLEMSEDQIIQRINSRYSNNTIYNQKTANGVDFTGLLDVKSRLSCASMLIVDQGNISADWICSKANELAKSRKPDVIIIDHLGIVQARDARVSRVLQIGEMTAGFKGLAKELNCPVILLHQLNRGVEGREDKRPTLSDLRDSGSVEQDADAVMMIYREEYYLDNKNVDEGDFKKYQQHIEKIGRVRGLAEIIVAKNRQGETGIVTCHFDGVKQEFSNLAVS